jgi:hypothetical protein
MRLSLQPLSQDPAREHLDVLAQDGTAVTLWTRILDWGCSDGPLRMQVIASERLALPGREASEPMVGAIARVQRAINGHGGMILLHDPATVFSAERIALAHGVRLFAIDQPSGEALWDAALSLGQAVYGVRGTLVIDSSSLHPAAVMSALAFGSFSCCEGLILSELNEDRSGVGFTCAEAVEATVIIHGGFEAATIRGRSGRWQDRGNEAYVRLRLHSANGTCWTQPRFIAVRAQTATQAPRHG